MTTRRPVTNWATDFDHLGDEWAADMHGILGTLREGCPVAHTDRFHGAALVTTYDDIEAVAHDTATFSSRVTTVNDNHPDLIKLELPPITLDPPDHSPIRRPLLSAFSPRATDELEPWVRERVRALLDRLDGRTDVDGALDFSQLIPVEVMARLFGVQPEMGPQFRAWVDAMLKEGQIDLDIARKANREIQAYFVEQLRDREDNPGDDLVTMIRNVTKTDADGNEVPFTHREQIGALFVLMLGGIDTTWSMLGASLFHLATHQDDLARLVAEPELLPTALEELLRFYAPVTIARVITEDADIGGCPVSAGERLLLSFPSANRDASHFDRPDEVVLDRAVNRHLAFGVGVHRCLGSNLARMELRVALEEWLARFPSFELAVDRSEIEWSVGPVRGPRSVPLRITA